MQFARALLNRCGRKRYWLFASICYVTAPLLIELPLGASEPLRYCPDTISTKEQSGHFSRVINIGASYTHGATGVDVDTTWRAYHELTNDSFWIRRQPILYFLINSAWKNRSLPQPDSIYVLENDPGKSLAQLLPHWQVEQHGYTGQWHFQPRNDVVSLLDSRTLQSIQKDARWKKDQDLVGGVQLRKSKEMRILPRSGILYKFLSSGKIPGTTLFDLAMDGGRIQDIFSHYGGKDLYKKLQTSHWKDAALREQVIQSTVRYMRDFEPSILLALDVLFWDSFAHTIDLMKLKNPNSLTVRFFLNQYFEKDELDDLARDVKRNNMTDDFYEVLHRLSVGDETHAPVPVILSRMGENIIPKLQKKSYEAILGALLGSFIKNYTGRDFSNDILRWLRAIEYARQKPFPHHGLNQKEHAALVERVTSRIAQSTQHTPFALDIQNWITRSRTYRTDAIGTQIFPTLPAYVTGITNTAILDALKDLPLFLTSFSEAFEWQNQKAKEFTQRPNNKIMLINFDDFLDNLGNYLKPESMHPSVQGARKMGHELAVSLCSGSNYKGLNP